MSDPHDPTRPLPPSAPPPGAPGGPPPPPGAPAPYGDAMPPPEDNAFSTPAPSVPPGPDDRVVAAPVYTTPAVSTIDPVADPLLDERSNTPLYAIIGVLSLIVLGLAVILLTGGDDGDVVLDTEPTITPTPVIPTPTPVPTLVPTDDLAVPEPTPVPTVQEPTAEPQPTTPVAPTPPVPEPPAAEPPPPPPAERPPSDPGDVRAADGRALFPIDEANLTTFTDTDVLGQGVLVQSVVDGAGFWIGTDEANRVFVQYDAGLLNLEYTPAAGERVQFRGTVVTNEDPALVPDDQGGEQFRRQGVHLELVVLEPAS
ncbi:hypothetical protein BH23ACT9_BH23ACT9_38490 [soil metagenome]